MNPETSLSELSAEWKAARLLYPLYAALAHEFVIDLPHCPDLEAGVDAPPQESVEQARQWFLEVDQRIQVHQLRQFLQTTTLTSDEALRELLHHHLHKAERADSDRDKVDFLLVQYFSHCTPSRLEDADVDMEYVAQVLEPVLGKVDLTIPAELAPLEQYIQAANHSASLNDLLSGGILDRGRKLKVAVGKAYFIPAAMIAFTRFSFLMRRVFFRLMHQDLNAIADGLRELESLGVSSLDCRRAQFGADEPTVRLRMICQSWKVMFHAEYSSGQPLRMLVDLRSVVDSALKRNRSTSIKQNPSTPQKAKAAAAAAGFSVNATAVPEFEVSAGSPAMDQDFSDVQRSKDDDNA
ncbi:MAG TPA: hypothetical protein VFA68_02565 [Terriglobales bacterium]|nr:hypothetical protein [Terriglobales bacterium]